MAQDNVKKSSQKKKAPHKPRMQHRFHMRENVYTDATTSQGLNTSPNSSGVVHGWTVITPCGLSTAYYDLPNTVFKTETAFPPSLRWLQLQSTNFNKLRVTRATLVIVGNMGSDVRGKITIQGFNDISDVGMVLMAQTGSNGRVIDLASLASREARIDLPINSGWKKVTSRMMLVGGDEPFWKPGNRAIIPVNSANDLMITGFGYNITGANTTERVCEIFLDYEVEFDGPLLPTVNR